MAKATKGGSFPGPNPNRAGSAPMIRFPYAVTEDGSLRHISSTESEQALFCPSCNNEFVARRGKKRTHHFAHAPQTNLNCSPESVLHKTAKLLIAASFAQRAAAFQDYRLLWKCSSCEEIRSADLVVLATQIDVEYRGIPGVVPDVFFQGASPIAVEVVVTSPPKSLEVYSTAAIPVLEHHPTWDTLVDLTRHIRCDATHYLATLEAVTSCEICTRHDAELATLEQRKRQRYTAAHCYKRKNLMQLRSACPSEPSSPASWPTLSPSQQQEWKIIEELLVQAGFKQLEGQPLCARITLSGLPRIELIFSRYPEIERSWREQCTIAWSMGCWAESEMPLEIGLFWALNEWMEELHLSPTFLQIDTIRIALPSIGLDFSS